MKRTIRRIIFSLVLGIITTVAVAWFFAAFVRPQYVGRADAFGKLPISKNDDLEWISTARSGSTTIIGGLKSHWPNEDEPDHGPNQPTRRSQLPQWAARFVSQDPQQPARQSEMKWYYHILRSSGWPIEAMWCDYEFNPDLSSVHTGILLASAEFEGQLYLPRALPTNLIWSGFAIDTAFYTLLWFGVLTGSFFTRRKWRIRKGRCPACGYDLRGSPITTALNDSACPECGARHVAGA